MTLVNGPGSSAPIRPVVGGTGRAVDLSHLQRTNPRLPALLQQHPGLRAFLEKHGGTTATSSSPNPTPVAWNAWFHSPATLRQDYDWKNQFIFVFQRSRSDTGTIDFGREGRYQGRLIGVHRLGDLDVPVRNRGGREGGTAPDGGFEARFPVEAVGQRGDDVEVCFCVGSLDDKGNPTGGWGTLGGYGGRQHDITIGVADRVPIHEDDHSYSELVPQPGGGYVKRATRL
jgi:hypothetical protein